MFGTEPASDLGSQAPLAKGRIDEAEGERLYGARRLGDGQDRDETRVEAAGEEGPPGDVAGEAAAYRLAQEVEDALGSLPPRRPAGPGCGRCPIPPTGLRAVERHGHPVHRPQRSDRAESRGGG